MNREIKPEQGEEHRERGGSTALPADAETPTPDRTDRTDSSNRTERTDSAVRPARPQAAQPPKAKRTSPRTYLREVRGELRRVAWPSAKEVRSYSLVVLVVVTLLMFYVFLLDQGIGQVVFQIFG